MYKRQKEKKAFASIRSKLSSEYKDRFQSAKNTHEKQLIMQKLYKLKIKGKCIYTSDTFKKMCIRDSEKGNR